ncbi:MAG: hypothetical protein JWM04_2737 [Verrucomicrobiales bacterium]|jgi:ABC-type transport system involved in cytochrome bd biosynthesis fused ATPase/permease subunit|nr:hypothetical protein [Verrucomicrobiales bacterium]
MNETKPSPTTADALLAQDAVLNSEMFSANRQKLLARLEAAKKQEKRGRKITLGVSFVCFVIMASLFVAASRQILDIGKWSENARTALAMVVILCFASSSLFAAVYLLRHRRELHRARRAAHQQTLNDVPQQLENLRKEIEVLRAQMKEQRHGSE